MRNLFFVLACGATAMAAPATSRQASSSVSMLYGHWQVTGVAVSDIGVQALARNDPAYMGRRLSFTHDRLAWDKPKAISTEAPCIAPTIRPTAPDGDPEARALVRRIGGPATRTFSVSCRNSPWGPAAPPAPMILALRDGTIGLWWFDGGLLKLRRLR